MFRNFARGGETSGELVAVVKGWSGSVQPLLVGGKRVLLLSSIHRLGKKGEKGELPENA
jgi:FKBP-type peptidyl-prolyl cis-trans isomerase